MHITITDPVTGETLAVLCVDRKSGTCTILQCNMDHIVEVTSIAQGMKVKQITMIVPLEVAEEFENLGWKNISTSVAMVKSNAK